MRIYRYEVPVDDRWHLIEGGPPVYVGSRFMDVVEFWAHWPGGDPAEYRVFGTGQDVEGEHVGTTYAAGTGGALVWHLYRRPVGGAT